MYELLYLLIKDFVKEFSLYKKRRVKHKIIKFIKRSPVFLTLNIYRYLYTNNKNYEENIMEINKILCNLELEGLLYHVKLDDERINNKMWIKIF